VDERERLVAESSSAGLGTCLAHERVPPPPRYLSPEDDQLLGDLGTRLVYSPGDVIVREGVAIGALYVLRRGRSRLERRDEPDGDALGWLTAIDYVGEGALLGAPVAPFTVVAESEVHADMVDARVLGEVVATRYGFAARLYRSVAFKLHERLARVMSERPIGR
jgi:CRP-like cAMP-binding protein